MKPPANLLSRLRRRFSLRHVVGWVVIIYLTVVLVQTVKHNHDLQNQIDHLNGQISSLQNQEQELQYKIQYYKTDSYVEKEARGKLDLQQPGEHVVVLPEATPAPSAPVKQAPARKPSNFSQWLKFIFG